MPDLSTDTAAAELIATEYALRSAHTSASAKVRRQRFFGEDGPTEGWVIEGRVGSFAQRDEETFGVEVVGDLDRARSVAADLVRRLEVLAEQLQAAQDTRSAIHTCLASVNATLTN